MRKILLLVVELLTKLHKKKNENVDPFMKARLGHRYLIRKNLGRF